MIFSWFDAKGEAEFGTGLAESYDKKFREIERAADKKKEEKRLKLVANVLSDARQYAKTHKLNVYKKAQLGNAFKWKLKDLGHDEKLVDLLTKDVLLALQ